MTRRVLSAIALGGALLLSTPACGGDPADPNAVAIPAASVDMEGENYQDIVSRLEDAGFTNVETQTIPDLITGWLTSDGEVETVSVNGRVEFDDGDEFPTDATIVISYHTFPSDEEPSAEPTSTEPALPEILTAKNNTDLAKILTVADNCDPRIGTFAKTYPGKTIEFDGSVINFANHGDYDTRFDILVGPGDYRPEQAMGPTFQFEDENLFDMNLTGRVPNRWGLGEEATFTATVDVYDKNSCLFHLDPVETHVR